MKNWLSVKPCEEWRLKVLQSAVCKLETQDSQLYSV